MRKLESITIHFIPSKNTGDPLDQRGYLTWKATIGGSQYGMAEELNKVEAMPRVGWEAFFGRAMAEVDKLCRMTPKQAAEVDAKIAAEAAAREASARAYWDAKPESERLV